MPASSERFRTALLALAGATAISVAARADAPPVSVDTSRCRDVDLAEVQRITAVELSALVSPSDASTAHSTRVTVTCAPPVATITVSDPLTAKTTERALDLFSLEPRARPRVLAIAIAELVSASWAELEVNPSPIVVPHAGAEADVERDRAREVVRAQLGRPRFTVGLGPTARTFVGQPMVLFGGSLWVSAALTPSWFVGVDVGAESGSTSVPIGVARVLLGSGAATGAFAFGETVRGEVGLGVRFGGARLRGTPQDDTSASGGAIEGFWGGPLALVAGSTRIGQLASLRLAAETGYALASVHGEVDGRPGAAVDGLWTLVSLTAAWTPR